MCKLLHNRNKAAYRQLREESVHHPSACTKARVLTRVPGDGRVDLHFRRHDEVLWSPSDDCTSFSPSRSWDAARLQVC